MHDKQTSQPAASRYFAVARGVLPAPVLSSGTIEALKWFAVACMTADHVNRYLLQSSMAGAYAIGRLALPIFFFILAYNLAQPGACSNGRQFRIIRRLGIFAILATIPYVLLNKPVMIQGWWPLNILFSLLLATGLVALLESGRKYRNPLAFLLFVVGGSLVEGWWAGLAVFFFSWKYVKSASLASFAGLLCALLLIGNTNGNQWGLASLPIIFAASHIELKVPRVKHALYVYYPLHLAIILLIQWVWLKP